MIIDNIDSETKFTNANLAYRIVSTAGFDIPEACTLSLLPSNFRRIDLTYNGSRPRIFDGQNSESLVCNKTPRTRLTYNGKSTRTNMSCGPNLCTALLTSENVFVSQNCTIGKYYSTVLSAYDRCDRVVVFLSSDEAAVLNDTIRSCESRPAERHMIYRQALNALQQCEFSVLLRDWARLEMANNPNLIYLTVQANRNGESYAEDQNIVDFIRNTLHAAAAFDTESDAFTLYSLLAPASAAQLLRPFYENLPPNAVRLYGGLAGPNLDRVCMSAVLGLLIADCKLRSRGVAAYLTVLLVAMGLTTAQSAAKVKAGRIPDSRTVITAANLRALKFMSRNAILVLSNTDRPYTPSGINNACYTALITDADFTDEGEVWEEQGLMDVKLSGSGRWTAVPRSLDRRPLVGWRLPDAPDNTAGVIMGLRLDHVSVTVPDVPARPQFPAIVRLPRLAGAAQNQAFEWHGRVGP